MEVYACLYLRPYLLGENIQSYNLCSSVSLSGGFTPCRHLRPSTVARTYSHKWATIRMLGGGLKCFRNKYLCGEKGETYHRLSVASILLTERGGRPNIISE